MMQRLLVAFVVTLASFAAAHPQNDAAERELAKLQGVWQLVSGEEDDKPSSDFLVENLRLAVEASDP
jgi:hypothetical protein